jgi:hypothetical protein
MLLLLLLVLPLRVQGAEVQPGDPAQIKGQTQTRAEGRLEAPAQGAPFVGMHDPIPVVEVLVPGGRSMILLATPGPAEGIAKDLAASLPKDWRSLEATLGWRDAAPLEVRIGYGKEEFDALQPPGVRVPGWAAGVAFSRLGLIVVDGLAAGRGGSVRSVLVHELAHVALGRSVDGRIPRWFNEGFALHAAGEWSLSRSTIVGRAALARALIPLSELEDGWPHAPTDVNLAYAQSASMVGHLISIERGAALRRLIGHLGEGAEFGPAIKEAYGSPLAVLEVEWKRGLAARYGWLPFLMDHELVWVAGALLLVVGGWRSKRRARRRIASMEDAPYPVEWDHPPGQELASEAAPAVATEAATEDPSQEPSTQ